MIFKTYTAIHVLISLVAIMAGFVIACGMLKAQRRDGWTKLFLATTALTSVTGFLFPFQGITPALVFGVVSLGLLGVAVHARYSRQLAGAWGPTYVVTTLSALYLNVFVLVVQSFQKIPVLRAVAPQRNEPPFAIAQSLLLIAFITLGVVAVRRFRREPAASASEGHASSIRP